MSDRPALEVADIIRAHGAAFVEAQGERLCGVQRRALHDLAVCRTAALGGHVEACAACGEVTIAYNSCRNRHCPKCQAGVRARWLERERGLLLPVDYHHVVFTLPHALNPLVQGNPAACYRLLFQSAWATLREVAGDPRYLGAEVGVVAVLHTWGQTLSHHPHLHCLVTGGGLSCDVDGVVDENPRWRASRPGYFLPVRVLSAVFRRHYLQGLQALHTAGRLRLGGSLAALADARAFAAWLEPVAAAAWVVNSKPPVHGDAEIVLKYLARYVHRVAISNSRLVSLRDGQVTFGYKDYAHGGEQRDMTLTAVEFLRRLMQHILPRGFVKVRHYGLLANRGRQAKLGRCRSLLGVVVSSPTATETSADTAAAPPAATPAATPAAPPPAAASPAPARCCPQCGGPLIVLEVWPRPGLGEGAVALPTRLVNVADTS